MRFALPRLHPSQQLVADCPARYRALVSGRQWGKTRLGAWLAVKEFIPQHAIVHWLAPTYQVSELGWRVARRLCGGIERAMPGALDVRIGDRAILSATGGELWFKSADRPDNLRGATLDFLVMDEADYCDEYVWTDVLQPMLGLRRGRALFISSPRLEGGWFHRLWQSGQPGNADIESFQFPTWDSPYWDPKEVAQARNVLPGITFRREYGAEFVSASGALVKREDIRIGAPTEELPVTIGVDLAISEKEGADYTAMVAMSRDRKGNVWIRDVVRRRMSFHATLQAVEIFAARWRPQTVAIEGVQYQAAAVQELLRTTRLPVRSVKPVGDKVTRFQALAARYEQHLVYHAPDLNPEFEHELLAFPVGRHDDMIDAAAYAFLAIPSGGVSVASAGRLVSADPEQALARLFC